MVDHSEFINRHHRVMIYHSILLWESKFYRRCWTVWLLSTLSKNESGRSSSCWANIGFPFIIGIGGRGEWVLVNVSACGGPYKTCVCQHVKGEAVYLL